jgi:hypothetical protein
MPVYPGALRFARHREEAEFAAGKAVENASGNITHKIEPRSNNPDS